MPSIAQTLHYAQSRGLDRLDAQLLLLHVLGRRAIERAWLLAHDDQSIPAGMQAAMEDCVHRRLSGEPLAYITGRKEFFGLDLLVDARVLVPRPETETLVEWALEVLDDATFGAGPLQILDLGTGSGAIALAIKASRPALSVSAIDLSEGALAVARTNAQRLQLDVHFTQGSWLTGVPTRYHAIVANPPYIAEQDFHLEALTHEPLGALSSGVDGLDDMCHIIDQARCHLTKGGWLLLEHGYDQAAAVRRLLAAAGFDSVQSRFDLADIERCSGGRAP